ncbi:glycosyl transferase family 2 [Psittacicella gerlachiana]|uniref:LPLAT superfamily acyltransferase n=1 Tax=Psittacicella gerlachiana TaxID=2028574 RepID=A0A3A1YHU8_9GAMM|nr:glycosyl transferase family 2 [Psittacicella gerlachiana]RIY36829.1 hypothetical protein CKF59_02120 [Psittacicella gerlachiana]
MNWKQQEKGNHFFLYLSKLITKYLPRFLVRWCTLGVVSFYYWRDRKQGSSTKYFELLQTTYPEIKLPKNARFQQYLNFGTSIAERFSLWQGSKVTSKFTLHDPAKLFEQIKNPPQNTRGQILFFSHLGDIQICQAFLQQENLPNFKLNILMNVQNSKKFNQTLKQTQKSTQVIQHFPIENLDPQTMFELEKRIAQGQWLAISADRLGDNLEKVQSIEFLGQEARFPTGPWLLANLLQAPINTIFCFKEKQGYSLYLEPLAPILQAKRKQREQEINKYLQLYVKRLENFCRQYPTMWFNFYDFWK